MSKLYNECLIITPCGVQGKLLAKLQKDLKDQRRGCLPVYKTKARHQIESVHVGPKKNKKYSPI